MKPAHKELLIFEEEVGKTLRIDQDGSIWRIAASSGGIGCFTGAGVDVVSRQRRPPEPIAPRRAEQRYKTDDYLRVTVSIEGKQTRALAHRLVWVSIHGRIPDGMEINHKNGKKDDNRPENMELVSPRSNVRHRIDVLGHPPPRGYRTGSEKLTASDVVSIRAARKSGVSVRDLAAKHGVTPQSIVFAAMGKTWKAVPL